MHFINRHGRMLPVGRSAAIEPGLVMPAVIRGSGDDRCSTGAHFKSPRIGVRLQTDFARLAVADFVFVEGAWLQVRQKQLPDAAAAAHPHGMAPPVPVIEIADDADAFGIRCPDREADARDTVHAVHVRAQDTIGMAVSARA